MSERPNILIFCTDEQRGDHLGCTGHADLKTPNIDRIAAEGTLFRNCYSSSPICMPARATMFTGLTNRVTGVKDNGISLDTAIPTLPGLLAEAGYRTHSVGKLHIRNWGKVDPDSDEEAKLNPERRMYWDWPDHWQGTRYKKFPDNYYGFQTIELANGHVNYVYGDYVTWLEEHHPGAYAGYKASNADPKPLAIDADLHYNTWIADRTIAFIEEHCGKASAAGRQSASTAIDSNRQQSTAIDKRTEGAAPFFLWCSFPDPHEPFAAVKKWSDFYADAQINLPENTLKLSPESRSETMRRAGLGQQVLDAKRVTESIRQTYGMVSHIDEQVGRVLDCLEEIGIAETTAVFFISDHGDQLGEHGLFYKSVYPYDGHAHIPFVAKVPGGVRGNVVEDVVSMLDLVPTALDLAGVAHPMDAECQEGKTVLPGLPGEVLTPVLQGGADPVRKNALIEIDRIKTSKGILQMRTLVTNDYKLVFYPELQETMLFDRRNDPLEMKNIADAPEVQPVVTRLLKQLLAELARTEMPHHAFGLLNG